MLKKRKLINRIKQDLNKDQHFLINPAIIKKEIEVARITKQDKIIEIGAGTGNLTKELIKKAGKVCAYEIDQRYAKELNQLKKKNKNLEIIFDNALKYSWNGYNKIVSNIPYSISEPVIMKAIKDNINDLVLIVGENFKKILEKKQTKIGIIANLHYNIEFIMRIDKSYFLPPPRVDSWLIKLTKKSEFSKIDSILISLLQRKGKIKNAILYSLVKIGKTKRQAREIIRNMNIDKEILEKPVSQIPGKIILRLKEEFKNIINEEKDHQK